MSTRASAVFFVAALLVSTARAGETTVYVDASATPPGDGSPENPYPTIGQAIVHQGAGGPIVVGPGTYVETLDIRSSSLTSTHGPLETIIKPVDPADAVVVAMGPLARLEGFSVTRDSFTDTQIGVEQVGFQTEVWVEGCIVTGHGRGVAVQYDLNLNRSTVSGNRVGLYNTSIAVYFTRSCIVHGNDVADAEGGELEATYSDVGVLLGGATCFPTSCTNNIDADPRFWGPAAGDFHLRADSPCIDTANPVYPPDPDGSVADMGALTYDPAWAPGTQAYCFGSDATCPCANGGDGLGGCEIPQGTGGVRLAIEDFLPNGAGGGTAELVGTGYPPASAPGVTVIRSPAPEAPPVAFGDGLRCVAAAGLVRVRAGLAQDGAVALPVMHGAGAGAFYYQLWNRSLPVMFCDPTAAFNLSNALEIVWP